jgi:hypothetical protein
MSHLAVVLPGSGYGPAGPALLVPQLAARQTGADVRVVAYPEWRPGMDEDRALEFASIVREQIRETIANVQPTRLTLLAKSLGCEVIARMDREVVPSDCDVAVVWATPVFGLPAVRIGAIGKHWRSLVVSGDADPYYDAAGTAAVLDAVDGDALIIPGADHSLEVDGDVLATVDGFRRLAEVVLRFLT